MIIQKPTGGTTQISLERYLTSSDDEFDELLWEQGTMDIEDPFYNSVIRKKRGSYDDDQFIDQEDQEELEEDDLTDLEKDK